MSGMDGDAIEGLKRIKAATQSLVTEMLEGVDAITERSQELVPKAPKRPGDDLPTLASTLYVKSAGLNRVEFGYSSRYAHWVHEHLWFKHPHGGQAKFLETAMLEKGGEAVNRIGEAVWHRIAGA